ncbi:MAG: hypothetical protein SF182_12745 [Deltaproteobacteria bacterium]|nr:hypothetical protein [Deltaproteobacteria bacterium]
MPLVRITHPRGVVAPEQQALLAATLAAVVAEPRPARRARR